jgi:hypothetical protein
VKPEDRLHQMTRAERTQLCREVVEKLSDYLEGTAPEDFCRRVDEMLAGCQPFDAYRNTLAATITLAGECREPDASLDEAYARSVAAVRQRLAEE